MVPSYPFPHSPSSCIFSFEKNGVFPEIIYFASESEVNPVRNSIGALNPAEIVLKCNPTAEQRGIISNGVNKIVPFTPLESPTIYGGDDINKASIPYVKGRVKAPFLTGFTYLKVGHFPFDHRRFHIILGVTRLVWKGRSMEREMAVLGVGAIGSSIGADLTLSGHIPIPS